jgi:hypothetical protein
MVVIFMVSKKGVSYANIDHSCKILNFTQNSFNNWVT